MLRHLRPAISAGLVLSWRVGAELGPCELVATGAGLPTAEEFGALAGEADPARAKVDQKNAELAQTRVKEEATQREVVRKAVVDATGLDEEQRNLSFEAPTLPLRIPEEPLVFDIVDAPASLKGMSEKEIVKLLKDTVWPRRSISGPWQHNISVSSHLEAEASGKQPFGTAGGGDPLFVDEPLRDRKLWRLLRNAPATFRAVRRTPMALLAKPKQGLRIHATSEPRWIQQVHGRTVWRLVKPGSSYVEGLDVAACGATVKSSQVINCEARPGSLLYVPAKWAWGSCNEDIGGTGFSLAVGASGYSLGWPQHFHSIAEGDVQQLKQQLQVDSGLVHIGDPATGATAMELAVSVGDVKAAKLLKEHGARTDDTGSFSMTYPIHHAATFGHIEMLEWLLEQGAPTWPRTKEEKTPLHLAAEHGHLSCVKVLTKLGSKSDLHAVGKDKYGAVHFAAKAGHINIVRALRDAGAELSSPDSKGCEPTSIAAVQGDIPLLQFFLGDEDLNPDAKCDRGSTAAHLAVRYGHLSVLAALKKHKANLRAVDDEKRTPLHVAVQYGMLDVIDWYAKAGVKKLSPKTPGLLQLAAYTKQYDSMRALLRHGASATEKDPRSGVVPAELASTSESFAILAEFGAKRPPGFAQRTCARGELTLLREMIKNERGFEDQLAEPFDGLYAPHWAAQGGHREVLSWLCGQMGANCSAASGEATWGRTPAHFAAWHTTSDTPGQKRDRVGVMRYLLQEQAVKVDVQDSKGITPLELAGVGGYLDLVKFLVAERGADISSLWRAKREAALDKKVEVWATKFAPKGAYGQWLELGLPPPGGPAPPAPPSTSDSTTRQRKKKDSTEL